ncbi:hypothetical protein F5Y19DRAFT_420734 [Xylariaceae sp. FL1651]|nr:hypothetical protein F5Y19DRAFT_420734 [Xylariaceae sp. FL1651]
MSFPTAFPSPTVSPVHEGHDTSFSSSQSSNPDSSTLCFESSFRLETPFPNQKADCEKHPKGKRKRTTSQDKSILEAAYNSNPKPDKAARLDIVKRVSLNEKEVQIWFQNRRQNDRRKSRPLSPQEIEALRYGGGMRVLSSDPMPTALEPIPAPIALPNAAELPRGPSAENTAGLGMERRPSSSEDTSPQHLSEPPSPKAVEAVMAVTEETVEPEAEISLVGTPPSSQKEELQGEAQSHSQTSATSIGYIANRWNTGSSFATPCTLERSGEDLFRLDSFTSSTSSTADNSPSAVPPPLSSTSQVRLSLSLDGKAELVSSQPSPQRPALQFPTDAETLPPVRSNRTLQRSRSALPGITLPPISMLTAHLPPQLPRGRSRDVHAWESCCDSDTRDELTRQAENEASGSAIAAISLVRSSSSSASLSNLIHNHQSQPQSAVLQSNPSKRNAAPAHRSSARGLLMKKPKFGRANSSVARMQSLPPMYQHLSMEDRDKPEREEDGEDPLEPEKKRQKSSSLFVILSPSGDSDKENWSPDEDGNLNRPRPLPLPHVSGGAGAVSTKMGTSSPVRAGVVRHPRRVGRILGEQDVMSKRLFLGGVAGNHRSNTAPAPGNRLRKGADTAVLVFEDGENAGYEGGREGPQREGKRDDEVERFMRGEVSPSKRPDMDCVAGLLSLSQGNWR